MTICADTSPRVAPAGPNLCPVSILTAMFPGRTGTAAGTATDEPVPAARLAADPVAVTASDTILTRTTVRAYSVALEVARSIPAVRKAEAVLGKLSTFRLAAAEGPNRLPLTDPRVAWLAQPDPRRTSQWLLNRTVSDLVWRDRCVWKITDRTLYGTPLGVERIHPERVDTITAPNDPDTVDAWVIDGREVTDPLAAGYVVFDAAGLGGLRRFGWELLTLYGQLQTAAGRYARAPHPYAILKNHGSDLDKDEILALLDEWEVAREQSGVGYLNDAMDYEPITGWSAKDLQLTEAREHAALEVARLFGLPAFSLDAKTGAPLTYGNIVEYRRDELAALSPWRTVLEQTLSLADRRPAGAPRGLLVPPGVRVFLDTDEYTRDDALTRMQVWATALDAGVLDLPEVRAAEPLAGVTHR